MVLDGGFEDCVDRLCMTYKNILSMLVFVRIDWALVGIDLCVG